MKKALWIAVFLTIGLGTTQYYVDSKQSKTIDDYEVKRANDNWIDVQKRINPSNQPNITILYSGGQTHTMSSAAFDYYNRRNK